MPAPVSPQSRKTLASESSSKSTVTVSANGPNAVISSVCRRIRRCTTRVGVGVVAAGVAGVEQQLRLGGIGRRGRARRARSRGRSSWSLTPGAGAGGRQPRPAAAPSGAKSTDSRCGNRRSSRGLAWAGRSVSVRTTCTQASSASAWRGSVEQRRRACRAAGPADAAPGRRRTRRVDVPVGVEVDQPGALVLVGLGERVGQRGAGVADRARSASAARAGGRARRSRRRRTGWSARSGRRRRRCRARCRSGRGSWLPATNAWAITTDRVPGGVREVGAHPAHRRGQRRLVAAGGQLPGRAQVVGLEVGDAVHRHRAVRRRRAAPGCRRRAAGCAGGRRRASISREANPSRGGSRGCRW